MQVYLVWYDNGLDYEDHDVSLKKIFASEEDAKAYVEEKNAAERKFVPDMTEEEYYAQDSENIYCTYDEWVANEYYGWSYFSRGKFHMTTEEVY